MTTASLSVGDVLADKYRIVRLLGRGGMGAVFAAEHTLLGQEVAIKLLLDDSARHRDARTALHQRGACGIEDPGRARRARLRRGQAARRQPVHRDGAIARRGSRQSARASRHLPADRRRRLPVAGNGGAGAGAPARHRPPRPQAVESVPGDPPGRRTRHQGVGFRRGEDRQPAQRAGRPRHRPPRCSAHRSTCRPSRSAAQRLSMRGRTSGRSA